MGGAGSGSLIQVTGIRDTVSRRWGWGLGWPLAQTEGAGRVLGDPGPWGWHTHSRLPAETRSGDWLRGTHTPGGRHPTSSQTQGGSPSHFPATPAHGVPGLGVGAEGAQVLVLSPPPTPILQVGKPRRGPGAPARAGGHEARPGPEQAVFPLSWLPRTLWGTPPKLSARTEQGWGPRGPL